MDVGVQIIFENGTGTWPWYTAVDRDAPSSYGKNLCGVISYKVKPVSADPAQANLVTMSGSGLTFAPSLANAPGTYNMILIGTLPNGISAQVPFKVTVNPCEADITWLPAQSTLTNWRREWSSDAFLYDITNTIKAFSQTPSCGYDIQYTIKWEDLVNKPGVKSTQQPVEVQFNAPTQTFKIEKCSKAQQPFDLAYDPECGGIPYEKNYRVWIETELVNEPRGAVNTQANFQVSIGNVCETDTLTLTDLIPSFTYKINTPANLFQSFITVNQKAPLCPFICILTLDNGNAIPSSLGITDFGYAPFFEMQTSDKSLNGLVANLKFTCTAPLSKTGPSGSPFAATYSFAVTYKDACYDTIMYPAFAESTSFPLYKASALPFVVGSSSLSCGPVVTSIASVTPNDGTTPVFIVNNKDGQIEFNPKVKVNDGTYTIVLNTCVAVMNNPLNKPSDITQVCKTSPAFIIKILDPCGITEIFANIFTRVMVEPQLSVDRLKL